MMAQKRFLISGRVQGVSYRRFAEQQANALGLFGLARNLKDGRVEILAEGSLERLVAYEASLAKGPTYAEVTSIEKEDVPAEKMHAKIVNAQFKVVEDGESPYEFN